MHEPILLLIQNTIYRLTYFLFRVFAILISPIINRTFFIFSYADTQNAPGSSASVSNRHSYFFLQINHVNKLYSVLKHRVVIIIRKKIPDQM